MTSSPMTMAYRKAGPDDHVTMRTLLLGHGANQWNHLPEDGVDREFSLLNDGGAVAFVATHENNIVGFAISLVGSACPDYLEQYCDLSEIVFIADVVVHPDCAGQGIGSELLNTSLEEARRMKVKSVFIERHEQNRASAGMMRKVGFELVETFYDPGKRVSGSRKSSILKIDF